MARFRRIMALATAVWPWISASIAMRLLLMGTYVGQALLMASILARLLGGAGLRGEAPLIVVVGALVFARFVLLWADALVSQATAGATKARLRAKIFTKLAELGPRYVGGERTGTMQAALVDGSRRLRAISPPTCRPRLLQC